METERAEESEIWFEAIFSTVSLLFNKIEPSR